MFFERKIDMLSTVTDYLAGVSVPEIALKHRCCAQTVYNHLKRENIAPDRDGSVHALEYSVSHFDQFKVRFLDGLLLSDGCLRRQRGDANALLSLGFKYKEVRYYFITPFLCYKPWIADSEFCFRAETKRHPDFTKQYQRWYPSNGKSVPDDLILDPVVCFNWFIGDGNYHQSKKYVRLATCGFSRPERQHLISLLELLGFCASSHKDGQLALTKSTSLEFLKYILSCGQKVPTCYLYKFGDIDAQYSSWVSG